MLWANSGRPRPKYSAAAPQAANVTFMKSGERPTMPQVARAQCSIIVRRCSRACRRRGTVTDSPTRSPVVGDAGGGRGIRHAVAGGGMVLHRERRGEGAHAVGQPGMRRHVLDPLPAEPDLALLLLEALDVLLARSRRHRGSSYFIISLAVPV